MRTVAFCEIEEYPRQVLRKHWPDVPVFEDIRKLKGEELGTIDVICGGFPCQPYSGLGLKKGFDDERDLWPHMLRIISDKRPAWVIGENVDRFLSIGWDRTKTDLEEINYKVGKPFVLPSITKANHRRNRAWFVAYTDSKPIDEADKIAFSKSIERNSRMGFTGQVRGIISRDDWTTDTPPICRVDDGEKHYLLTTK